jgi:hypothetical protein
MSNVLHQRIKTPLFHCTYDVVVGDTMNDIKRFLKETPHLDASDSVSIDMMGFTYVINTHGTYMVIVLSAEAFKDAPDIYSTLVHEITHLSWYILEAVGIEITTGNHEIQAYLNQSLYEDISKVIKEYYTL